MKHTTTTEAPKELRAKFQWAWEEAHEHAHADHRCGRAWVCACGACKTIRKEVKRLYNRESSTRSSAVSNGYALLQMLNEQPINGKY